MGRYSCPTNSNTHLAIPERSATSVSDDYRYVGGELFFQAHSTMRRINRKEKNIVRPCVRSIYASIDTNIDPNSRQDFLEKTRNKAGTLGEMMDRSAELSEKRKELNGGTDPVQTKYFENYSKKRKGLKHQNDPSKYKLK